MSVAEGPFSSFPGNESEKMILKQWLSGRKPPSGALKFHSSALTQLITGRACDVDEFIHTELTASSSSVVPVSCWVRVHWKDGETRLANRWRHHFLFTLLPHRTDVTNINLLSSLCPRPAEDGGAETDRQEVSVND